MDLFWGIGLVGFFAIALATLLILLWPREGKLGINLSTVRCPRCNQRMPMIRKPSNERQALWGGWTCKQCGCEMDKYGLEIAPDTENESEPPEPPGQGGK